MTGTGTAASIDQDNYMPSAAQTEAQFWDFTTPACDEMKHEMNLNAGTQKSLL